MSRKSMGGIFLPLAEPNWIPLTRYRYLIWIDQAIMSRFVCCEPPPYPTFRPTIATDPGLPWPLGLVPFRVGRSQGDVQDRHAQSSHSINIKGKLLGIAAHHRTWG